MKKEKDVVMFIRYNNLTPVMIFACNSSEVYERLRIFDEEAPFGFVVLGSIVGGDADFICADIKEKYQFVQTNESWYEISEREVYCELIKYAGE